MNRILIASAAIAQAMDLATMGIAVSKDGIAGESNPLMRLTYQAWGMAGPAALKLIVVTLLVVCVIAMFRTDPKAWSVRGLLLFTIAIGVFGVYTNVRAF